MRPRGWPPHPGRPPILPPRGCQNTGNGTPYDNADWGEALCLGHGSYTHVPNQGQPGLRPRYVLERCTRAVATSLFADGSVHFMKTGMDPRTWQYMMTIAGSEITTNY